MFALSQTYNDNDNAGRHLIVLVLPGTGNARFRDLSQEFSSQAYTDKSKLSTGTGNAYVFRSYSYIYS
jgi:hypothetical protein